MYEKVPEAYDLLELLTSRSDSNVKPLYVGTGAAGSFTQE